MAGETKLKRLLSAMSPRLRDEEFVFCSVANASYGDFSEVAPVASFLEPEGLTLVVEKNNADRHRLTYQTVFRCISLDVHSSLEAVGLTAAISSALAVKNISANVIAAYYHDHVFVPAGAADAALRELQLLAQKASP